MSSSGEARMDMETLQGFDLSPQQKRLWLLQQATLGTNFHSHCAVRLEGSLDPDRLARALIRVVAANEILRTVFRRLSGMSLPLQVVLENAASSLTHVDLAALTAVDRESATTDLFAALNRQRYELDEGGVLRAWLLALNEREYQLLLGLPALCADPATIENLVAEIAAAYERLGSPEPAGEPEGDDRLQYADLSAWQNGLFESAEGAEPLEEWRSYWREHEIAAKLAWPAPLEDSGTPSIGEGRAAAPPFEPASLKVSVEPPVAAVLARNLTEPGIAAADFLLACWQVLLWRSTGQADVLVGVLHDGRRYEELRPALGPLARYLPVDCRLEETMRFRDVLALVQASVAEAARRQERFSWLYVDGEAAAGFFPVCFQARERPREWAVDGLRGIIHRHDGLSDRFKLELVCCFSPDTLDMVLRYDPHRFDRTTIELLAERLSGLLADVVTNPDTTLRDLVSPGARERQWLAEAGAVPAAKALPENSNLPLHRLFELQVESTPERVALVGGGISLTYAALNLWANRLAHRLRSCGVGVETPVALCLERSVEAVVALLAVLKAGGAWVPLDPSLPPDRLAWILDDAGARVVVTRESWRHVIPDHDSRPGLHVLCLDSEAEQIARRPGDDLPDGAAPENLAYAIYTSGSTGRPKGVLIEHRSAVNLLAGLETAVLAPLGGACLRASLNAPLAFDASVQQLVLLLAGHTLCVIPEEVRTDGPALLDFLRDHGVDLFDCTPSQLRILLTAGLIDEPGAPSIVLAAGEAIDAAMWSELSRSMRTTFFNIYGPTECTVDSTAECVGRSAAGSRSSIGRPLAGYGIHLLDRDSREVPAGAPGELCIGGLGLARGYLGRPELTAEKFVPHPFATRGGERLYRSGDLARFLPDGRLEFLGRIDHQVKVRGYRIEPGEIESVLAEHSWVRKAAVVAHQAAGEGSLLVAYLVASPEAPAGLSGASPELHDFLRRRLPVYMVPSVFIGFPAFPLTPSGKVDRQALALKPLPARSGSRSPDALVAPRNEAEAVLAAIWREVLRLDEVSVEDNFFQLGGDSILSIQVVSRASQAGLRVTARQLFEHQTITGLARVAEAISPPAADSGLVLGPVPLTPVQRSFLEHDLPHPEHYNHSLLLEPEPSTGGRLDAAALRRASEILLAHHDALRMRFAPPDAESPEWRQTNAGLPADLPWAEVDLSALEDACRVPALETVAAHLQTAFDLARGPLLRVVLFHVGENAADRLLLLIHHLVVDGVSWRILLDDMETAYRQLLRGEEPSLPAKTASFQGWAERLVEHARPPAGESQAVYWLERANRTVSPLPADYAGGANTVGSTHVVAASLNAEETRLLLQEVPHAYRTQINDVLITAVVETVSSWTGSRRLWLELEGHGREEIFPDLDVSRTVGWFTTVFPVLLDLDGVSAPGDALKTVKEQLRAVPERGFGFGVMRFLGAPEIASPLKAVPQGGILFNYLGQLDQTVAEGRLFRGARESAGAPRSPLHPRTHLLEVTGTVTGSRLWISWTYSEACHRRATIEALAQRCIGALRSLIAHCLSPEAGGYTPSDFPLVKIDQPSLEPLVAAAGGALEDLYPVAPMQLGMLFHTWLVPGSGTHVGQLNLLFQGGLDLVAFAQAWRQVIARHAPLRTGFAGFDRERPLQLVHAQAEVPLRILDWRALPGDRRRELLVAFSEQDLRQDFDLSRPPLMRLSLIREENRAYRLFCTHHHAILDGWSLPILLREFLACYQAAMQGQEAALEPVVPYRDYMAWLVRQEPGAAESYWRRELAGFAEPTPLGGETHSAEGVAAPLHTVSKRVLSPASTSALGSCAREQRVTMNTLLQGAWALLLWRLSGRSDVVFGVVSSGRSVPVRGIEEMVGLFINTLPARVRLRGGVRLPLWLQEIQEHQAQLRQYEHSSLAEVQGWSEVAAGLPLFESIVAFENFPVDESVQRESGETFGIAEADVFEQTVYPLGLSVSPGPRLSMKLRCDPRRFSAASASRMLDQLEDLLHGMVAHGERFLDALPLLGAAERHQILIDWNDKARPPASGACLPERIASWSEARRDAIAVASSSTYLSYGALAARARRWGAWLRGRGVRQESVVGLSLGRSPALIEALLGVWQAEALFVVLDPALPPARRDFVVADAGVALVLTEAADGEPWTCPAFAVREIALPADPGTDRSQARLPEGGAYAIYTSGSTGRPKGVLVQHAGLRDLLENQEDLLGAGPSSRVLQWASWSFDAAIADLAMALGAGGTLVLGAEGPLLGGSLADLLAGQAISHCTVTPSALATVPLTDLPALTTLIVAGEVFPGELAGSWGRGRRLMNHYGPTEATVWATAQRITEAGGPPIGRPIGGVRVYVLDSAGVPVAPGTVGELALGGAGIVRGYLQRPELTAERFVPDPFGGAGDRLYRTGDRARFLLDGSLQFHGRLDDQVKVRGFRVELGEIETILASHPQVEGAAVVAQTAAPGDQRLAAFVVPKAHAAGLADEMREFLRRALPEHMIPNSFVLLDRLPLNASGKVDRKDLERWKLEHGGAAPGSAVLSEARPRTPVEELIAGAFAEVLRCERIGIDEDFFAAGGHSLTAMQVMSRVRTLFGVEVPLAVLFDNPTAALLARRSEELRALDHGPSAPPILPVPRDGDLPLSFAQERLWFLDQLDPGMTTYNLPMALGLRGSLNRALLDATLSHLVLRHESLRTRFASIGGRAVQMIDPPAVIVSPVVDLTAVPAERREALARDLAAEEAGRPFDLARGPLLRVTLLQLDPERHAVLLTAHHIVADGWSLGILVRELTEIYSALCQGRQPDLRALPLQYADWAVWQRDWFSAGALARQLDFWRERLAGAPTLLALPLDRPRPPMQSHRGAQMPILIPREVALSVEALGRKHGATLSMTYLAAFAVLLSRLCGQDDCIIGTPVANRNRLETENLIGFFVNTLALRVQPRSGESFAALLAELREQTLGAYSCQDLPFEILVEELAPERSLAHSPLFQVMFDLQNVAAGGLELPGLTLEPFALASGSGDAKFDLTLSLFETQGWLTGGIEYSTALFDAATIARLASHFTALLAAGVANPDLRLSHLPLFSAAERHQLLAEWGRAALAPPSSGCLQTPFESQVEAVPDAIAVVGEDVQLSYRELDRRASRLGRHLVTFGVGPEVRVGICAERTPEMVVGLLAILKAGGAYVPLDPGYPAERLAFILADAGVRVVLTQERLAAALPAAPAAVVYLDGNLETAEDDGFRHSGPDPRNAAYMIYTSGSTGRPKGVIVEHRSAANYVTAVGERFALSRRDRVLQFASLNFDTSVEEIFPTLAQGACLVLRTEAMLEPAALRAGCERQQVTVLDLPTAYWHSLVHLAADVVGRASPVRLVVIGGEEASQGAADAWRLQAGRRVRLLNSYGPTEATVVASWCEVTDEPAGGRGGRAVPLGFAGRNARLHVLDPAGQPAPIGVAGELHIGGAGLARGYNGRPDLTAERFIPDPFEPAGARMYRTGDLARYLADGKLEFLGRIDQQVKVRGFRIEPGEIETLLAGHPEVAQAVVVVREDRPGDKRLAAYVVGRDGRRPEVAELRELAAARLPEYMVPSAFVVLPSLPLTPHGKVDRRALPAPERARHDEGDEAQRPRSEAEALLAGIWCEVLGLERVGVDENFFELGGDSILSIQVVARAGQAGLRLTARQIFEHQTVAGLARVAEVISTAREEPGLVIGAVPLTPIQRDFLDQDVPHPEHFNHSLLLQPQLAADGRLEAAALRRACEAMLRHHDALRMRFLPPTAGQPAWHQRNEAPPPDLPWAQVDLSAVAEADQSGMLEAAAADLQTSLNLTRGPLLRMVIFRLGENRPDRLLLIIHHLVVDGVSWRIVLDDLEAVYRQQLRGEPPLLPAKTTSFRGWAERLVEYARSPVAENQAGYWLQRSGQHAASLPLDLAGRANTLASARMVSMALEVDETRLLLQEVPRTYRTQINDVLMTALVEAVGSWTGRRKLWVELEGHGREEIFEDLDVSRTVGWFTSLFPVLLDLEGIAAPGEAVKAVKEQLRAVPQRGFAFGLLRFLGREEISSRLRSLPQGGVVFNYLGQLDQAVAEGRLFRAARESAGPGRCPLHPRTHLLEVSGHVAGGRLWIGWSYSESYHRRATIETLAQRFLGALRSLIAHCREVLARREGRYTPVDFPLAGLGAADLDRVLDREWGIEDLYPLSPLQEGLLFHSLYAPGSGVYVEQVLSRIPGGLDVDRFETAWRRVVAAHPILRTSFRWQGLARPLQVVHGEPLVSVAVQDWQALPPERHETLLESLLRADRERGFDLSRPPLMRWTLIRTGPREHWFLWTQHHILLDGWSFSALAGEVLSCYAALCAGGEPRLSRRRPYRDYIAWLGRQDLAKTEEYWRRTLAGWQEPTPLAVTREIDRTRQGAGKRWVSCTAQETAGLQRFARRQRLTLNTLVQGAFGVLLSWYSDRPEVVFGATVSGRPADLPGVESIIGLFINTLPVRLRAEGSASLLPWLQELQRQQSDLRQHEHAPLVKVQEWSEVASGTPLFESILVFENFPRDAAMKREGSGLGVAEVRVKEQTHYPLTASSSPGDRLLLSFEYALSHFEAVTMERMLGHFRNLLLGMPVPIELGAQRLSDLPLLSGSERHQLVVGWNDTARPGEDARLVHELFAQRAQLAPEAVAVVHQHRHLSYGELDRQSDGLARHLRHLGVGPEVPVGLCAERSLEMIVGLLGILKSGGAFVPLDPGHPPARLAYMIADAGVRVVLTEERLKGFLPEVETLWLDGAEEPEPSAGGTGEAAIHGTKGENLAYVIYTSGSTGQPKGVMVEHASLASVLAASRETFDWTAEDAMACAAPFAFDIFLFELLNPLLSGGRCRLLPLASGIDVEEWVDLLLELTQIHAVPALMRQLVDVARRRNRRYPRLRSLFVGGDRVPLELLVEMREVFPEAWIHVLYGPTEATIIATSWTIPPGNVPRRTSIGRPLPNVELLVLDARGQVVPIGVAGEIWIGGPGVTRGYLDRPELTADRYPARHGRRFYRTGDLARWRTDGALEFLGRTDQQVKVRGFRIEPGEIEAVLCGHPQVERAVVVAHGSGSRDRSLAAYLVGKEVTPAALRSYLLALLPDYMVPSVFIWLENLPLTSHGKVDRKALPFPEERIGSAVREGPRNAVEELLCGIWSEVLGLERVGRWENFFELGGHSLLATQVASRVRATFGVELPLRVLFEGPTVEALGRSIEEWLRGPGQRSVPAIVPVPRSEELPLSFAQERLWFLDQLDPGMAVYNLPMALGLRGNLDPEALRRSLNELVRRHEVLRTRYVKAEARPAQVIDEMCEMELPLVDLQILDKGARTAEARRLLRQVGGRPFDLSREHPLRAGLLRLEPDRHTAWLTMHHIAADGWSMSILVRELSSLYAAEARGEAPELPELAVQYADFAFWQRGWLAGEELERQLAFWRQHLAGVPPLLALPLDRPRPAAQSFRGASVPFELPSDLAQNLAALSRSKGATAFMVLLAGLSSLLSRVTAQEDLVVGTAVANRNRREIEDLIGFFINMLALRMKTASDPSFVELILQARETALGSYAHQDLPFEKLVEELAPQRSRAHSPLFQIHFVLQNAPEGALELPGLTLEPAAVELAADARFDLILTIVERAGGVHGTWEYSRDLFDATTIRRLADHFRTLLGAALHQPDRRLSELPLLGEPERHQLLSAWNDTSREAADESLLCDVIATQAACTPEAPAVAFAGRLLTYGELDRRSNQVARHLHRWGVVPGVLVGLFMERSLEMVVGILGVLKAGGAYLPLDPEYPTERLATMLADSGTMVVLTQDDLTDALPAFLGVPLALDSSLAAVAAEADGPVSTGVGADDLAYVIYTSGSTGEPKGVAVTHRGLANLAVAQSRLFEVGPGSRVLQFSSVSFDAAVSEIVVTLSAGASLCLAARQATMPGPDLARLLREEEITVVTLPPSALAVLPEAGYPTLRTLVVAGESCPAELARRWSRGRRMLNAYGPTELTVCASADLVLEGETLSIGRPIDGTRLEVLDRWMNPVPIGAAGELYLAGPGLARGYLGRPEATAESFVPDPFGGRAGGRLYRTGDRVRRLVDGRVEFLGRTDRQVKLRGFRIELGEIEAALARHPSVGGAAVLVREEHDDRRLVAYVVPRQGEVAAAELRAFLRAVLPEHMAPSHFIALERLPLLPSGKVDLRSLAAEKGHAGASAGAGLAPRNPWEAALAEIFAEVLGVESVGVRDDFFDLGGHSLLAVGLASRIEKRFGYALPLAVLFEAPTAERLAQRLFEPSRFASWSPLVAMQTEGANAPFFCVHAIGGGVSGYYRHLMRHLGPDQPFYGLQARGLEEYAGLPHPSIEAMASEYVAAVRTVQPHGPYLLGGASFGGWIAFEMAQQLTSQGEHVALLALFDTAAPEGGATDAQDAAGEAFPDPDPAVQGYGMARAMAAIAGKELRLSLEELQGLPLEEVLALLLARAREAGFADETIDVPWLLRYRQGFNDRMRAGERYRARPYSGTISLFRTTPPGAAAPGDPGMGWPDLAPAGVEVHWIPGSHETMFLPPHVSEVAAALAACIERYGARETLRSA